MAGMLAIGSASIRGDALLAAGPFARCKQRQRERAAEQGAHARPEQPRVDRIADHEETAERQRQTADPDHPAGADTLLESRDRVATRVRQPECPASEAAPPVDLAAATLLRLFQF